MAPTLLEGDRVLATRGRVRRGVIVVVELGGGRPPAVKRVAARSGPWLWVLGDAPRVSTDSRQLGWLPRRRVLGVLRWRYAPAARVGLLYGAALRESGSASEAVLSWVADGPQRGGLP